MVIPDLPSQFSPSRTLDRVPNNLPRQLTSFVGREHEIAEIKTLLGKTALLTLTGVGGSGKTRLALQVTADIVNEYPDGAWWVPFAPIAEPAFVPQALTSALGIREHRGLSTMDVLCHHLRHKTLLLVLDNVEHLLEACAILVDTLLRSCVGLRVLATGREPLRVEGEHIYPVPPLAVPSSGMLVPVVTLRKAEAVRLFVDRAIAVRPSFALSEQNAAAVLQICRRVEGIPLALELAAARVKALSVEQIAARLDDQFRLLTDSVRIGLARHQTLGATMDWSYDLLTDQERVLFGRLAVFAGGFSLEAVELVCAGDGLEPSAILDLLTRLVEKSLVLTEVGAKIYRYRLLEPVRQYALAKLRETDAPSAVLTQHRDVFLAMAEQGYVGLAGPDRMGWRSRLEADHDNIRAALRWSIDAGDLEQAARLGASMARFWVSRGFLHEGWTWLTELRRHENQVSAHTRARLLCGIGLLAFESGEHEQAEVTEHALAIFREHSEREDVEVCARLLGMVAAERGNYTRAAVLLDEAAGLARDRGNVVAEAEALRQRGYLAAKQAEYALAEQHLQRSLAVARQSALPRSIGFALGHLAQIYCYQGALHRAVAMLREALSQLEAVEHSTGIAYFLNILGLALLEQGDYRGCAEAYKRSLALAHESGYKWGIAQNLIGAGALAAAEGDRRPSVRLLAAAGVLLRQIDYVLPLAEQVRLDRLVEELRQALEPEAFTEAWGEGQVMSIDQAVDASRAVWEEAELGAAAVRAAGGPQAVGVGDAHRRVSPPAPAKQPVMPLSHREQQVAALVVQGLTNREIAETLGIAEKTANAHIQNILNKLGFNSRAQIAAWAATQDLLEPPP